MCVKAQEGLPLEKSYSSMRDGSHLIGKREEPITANRSTPQAAGLSVNILDGLERVTGIKKW